MYKYWHLVDQQSSSYNLPLAHPSIPNLGAEIGIMATDLAHHAPPDIAAHDVVWLAHLVGDIHQPLHAASRLTKNNPRGDAAGSLVSFCAPEPCRGNLHAYWHSLLGATKDPGGISKMGEATDGYAPS
jgi:S1/P1 nuclease